MELNKLTAISPVDGRYRKTTECISPYFSEFGLMKYRVWVEIEYLIALSYLNIKGTELIKNHENSLRNLYKAFSEVDAQWIKDKERITNHDVKAVEYFVKDRLVSMQIDCNIEMVHFGLTSQDINNTAIPMSIKHGIEQQLLPVLSNVLNLLSNSANEWQSIAMLAKTHGQAASPTTLGKEMHVFLARLQTQIEHINSIPFHGKFGGATGNMNAHFLAFPEIDWHQWATVFLECLGLKRSYPTTQIEHYDQLANLMDTLKRINTILIDLTKDMWMYIMMDYFKQKTKEGEIGSSAMPHKVNPIDFENAEGNLMYANAMFEFLSSKLPVSRLQRDLTDSTVLRNIGMPIAHSLIAYQSIIKGWNKLIVNQVKIDQDLNDNWSVCAEAIQTILRREQIETPYEKLKDLTRGKNGINMQTLHEFIDQLDISSNIKTELKQITPFNYIGK